MNSVRECQRKWRGRGEEKRGGILLGYFAWGLVLKVGEVVDVGEEW